MKKKLSISRETLRVLSGEEVQGVEGAGTTYCVPPTERGFTLCVPTVCQYRDCE